MCDVVSRYNYQLAASNCGNRWYSCPLRRLVYIYVGGEQMSLCTSLLRLAHVVSLFEDDWLHLKLALLHFDHAQLSRAQVIATIKSRAQTCLDLIEEIENGTSASHTAPEANEGKSP